MHNISIFSHMQMIILATQSLGYQIYASYYTLFIVFFPKTNNVLAHHNRSA